MVLKEVYNGILNMINSVIIERRNRFSIPLNNEAVNSLFLVIKLTIMVLLRIAEII